MAQVNECYFTAISPKSYKAEGESRLGGIMAKRGQKKSKIHNDIKKRFGKDFRTARDRKKLSRAVLGVRIGVSPKTIQSWEMGRTFIEDLSRIPEIEAELDIAIWQLIAKATHPGRGDIAAESTTAYGKRRLVKAGPISPHFDMHTAKSKSLPALEKFENGCAAVPLLNPHAVTKPIPDLTKRDSPEYIVIPGEWIPRGGVIVAFRMGDSAMTPMIPLGATVIIDRRPLDVKKALNKVVVLNLHDKRVKIRRLIREPVTDNLAGMTALEGQRGKAMFRPDLGDTILGSVVGILAQP